jgi:nitrite reductase/ring-hydroxylating ferredoxin subunit
VFAFDATCPNSEECLTSGVVEHRDGYGVCKKCSSRYSLIDGKHADKKIKLRAYYVQPLANATDYFRVYN